MNAMLISPSKKYEASWRSALAEFEEKKEAGFWNVPSRPTDIDEYISRCMSQSQGEGLSSGRVPSSTFWLVDDGEVIGFVNIRHELSESIKILGGHIGYAIRPSMRGKGYGTTMLRLALEKAPLLKLDKVLITCDDDNIGSIKIIENNGGMLDRRFIHNGVMIRHYWVEV